MTPLILATLAFWDSLAFVGFGISGGALFAASLVGIQGGIHLHVVWLAALAGVLVGDNVSYAVGRFCGSKVQRAVSPKAKRHIEQAEEYVKRYGMWGVILGRFFWFTRKIVPFTCGALQLRYDRFVLADAIACFIWVSFWCGVLWLAHKNGGDLFEYIKSLLP